mmetsp:Transcript_40607/g.130662  ORF Transcript_40607/g.130662 Transcript_40607/m.130662 type:complete len:197 (+) Transcript_40607:91-681(+)
MLDGNARLDEAGLLLTIRVDWHGLSSGGPGVAWAVGAAVPEADVVGRLELQPCASGADAKSSELGAGIEWGEQEKAPLIMSGRRVLHLLATLAVHVGRPLDDARAATARVRSLVGRRRRLASLIAASGLRQFVRQRMDDGVDEASEAQLASTCEALFGAFVCEMGWQAAALAGLWRWLLDDRRGRVSGPVRWSVTS